LVATLNRKKLTPEEKVNLAISMTDFVIEICAEGIRNQNPNITEAKLREKT